jgi:DNA-binding protein H-NS
MDANLDQIEAELAETEARADVLRKMALEVRREQVAKIVSDMQRDIVRYKLSIKQVFGPLKGELQPDVARRADGRQVRRRTAAQPKYQDRKGNTWSGRGKQPRWFADALVQRFVLFGT